MALSCAREIQVGYEETLTWKCGQALEQADQGGGRLTILEVFKEHVDVVLRDVV